MIPIGNKKIILNSTRWSTLCNLDNIINISINNKIEKKIYYYR